MQLFGDGDITEEPPEPRPSWRDDCSLVLGKEVTSPFSSFIQSVTFRKKDPSTAQSSTVVDSK